MIQFKRGNATNWRKNNEPLADGQPGYDRSENKLKIGDGKTSWENLDYLVGELDVKRLLSAESNANRLSIFTYGTKAPTSTTKGKIYLQQFDGAAEVDYVVEIGKDMNYFYRKWNSGFIETWGKGEVPSRLTNLLKTTIFEAKTGSYFEVKGFWK